MKVRVYINTNDYDYREVTGDIELDISTDIKEEMQEHISSATVEVPISSLTRKGKLKIKNECPNFPTSFNDPCYTTYGLRIVSEKQKKYEDDVKNCVYILVTEYDDIIAENRPYEINGVFKKYSDASDMADYIKQNKPDDVPNIINQRITQHLIL